MSTVCYDCEFNGLGRPCRGRADMRDFALMAETYLRYWAARLNGGEPERRDAWIGDCLHHLEHHDPAAALRFIVHALDRIRSAEMLAVHAAGPMENVLARFGTEVIGAIERLALASPKFRLLLSGIWGRNRIDPAVWTRIVAAVAPGPVFCDDFRTPGHASGRNQASSEAIGALLDASAVADLGGEAALDALIAREVAPAPVH